MLIFTNTDIINIVRLNHVLVRVQELIIGSPRMCWQGSIFYSRRNLLSLPTELLHEICKHLGPFAILILRRV